MNHYLSQTLLSLSNPKAAETFSRFFKPGHKDTFLGVKTELLRKLAKENYHTPLESVLKLMESSIYEERALASHILVVKYQKGDAREKQEVVDFYLKNKKHIHDWSNVDNSAPYILGPHLLDKSKEVLFDLVNSTSLWDRRIAIVTTWWFIRHNEFHTTIDLAKLLLNDKEDLIHKATGWMLRELGKRNLYLLEEFLRENASKMPRMMLSYALEKFPNEQKSYYRKSSKTNQKTPSYL